MGSPGVGEVGEARGVGGGGVGGGRVREVGGVRGVGVGDVARLERQRGVGRVGKPRRSRKSRGSGSCESNKTQRDGTTRRSSGST